MLEENTLKMNVELERLRLEIFFSQPLAPPRYDFLPRRSHAAGTRLDEPGVPHAATQQTEQEGIFPFQASFNGFFHVDCTRTLEQEGTISFQAGVGVKHKATTTAQVAARQEFARPPKNRQQRGVIGWSAKQNNMFDSGEYCSIHFFSPGDARLFRVFILLCLFCSSVFSLSAKISRVHLAGTRGGENFPPNVGEIGIHEQDG